jgi:DNA end-binding protein Ku
MAERPLWRGHLRLALVSCPVALFSARRDHGGLHFHLINPKTGNRVQMVTRDAESGQDLQRSDLAKGYEYSRGRYLLMENADFERARVESSSVLKIDKFIDEGVLDPGFIDATYFLLPDGDSGEDVYVVLREAMQRAGKMALSRLVISQRERPVAIAALGRGLVVRTLNEMRDLVDPAEMFRAVPDIEVDKSMVDLAVQLIHRQAGRYDPTDTEDRYEAKLRAVIDARVKGAELTDMSEAPSPASNVIDLMAALQRSLGESDAVVGTKPAPRQKAKRPPKKAPPSTPAKTKRARR